ncbi:MAG: TonB family protein [Myxococcota bacterium]
MSRLPVPKLACALALLLVPVSVQAHEPEEAVEHPAEEHPPSHVHALTRPPRILQKVEAVYPESARRERREGVVHMRVTIDEEGHVSDVHVVGSAGADLDAAAMDAVRQFHFSPAEIDGEPAPVQIDYRMSFVLTEEPPLITTPVEPVATSLRIVLTDEVTGEPLPGASVRVAVDGAAPREVHSDESGQILVDSVSPGRHTLALSVRGYEPFVLTRHVVQGEQPLGVALMPTQTSRFQTVVRSRQDRARLARGSAESASAGAVGGEMINARSLLRPGEVMETIPGMVISQHSGEGKANQYYLRGFNLDHGTDFATHVGGMPVNMVTHGHGQGWTDLNFVIPELLEEISYRKGPYFAQEGDFSSAGAAHLDYGNAVRENMLSLRAGLKDWRVLAAASPRVGRGHLLTALELVHVDGPWELPSDFRKVNAVLRYGVGDRDNGWNLTGMLYQGRWSSTDQVPLRAITSGTISRLGNVDPSDGGNAHRISLSGAWARSTENLTTRANVYVVESEMNLWSNFTYFLEDPVHGDQFHQHDARNLVGGAVSQEVRLQAGRFLGVSASVGAQSRTDLVRDVSLASTERRTEISLTRRDQVLQSSLGVFVETTASVLQLLRLTAGMRADGMLFMVSSNNPANSGRRVALIHSPKLGVVLGPWARSELFFNLGYGFHSNDARGTTITVDPKTREAVGPVDPLVRTRGGEVGFRSTVFPGLQTTLAIWGLELSSELVFVGDAGTTEESRPSRRVGLEWSNVYSPLPWLSFDADVAITDARFTMPAPEGDRVPGALERVLTAGVTVHDLVGLFGSLRLRHFGARPLVEDNSVRSTSSTWLNAQVGYELSERWRASVELFNLLNAETSDVEYYYASRLPGERPGGVLDVHTHPAEPFTLRVTLTALLPDPS